jgi:hypothetical protein
MMNEMAGWEANSVSIAPNALTKKHSLSDSGTDRYLQSGKGEPRALHFPPRIFRLAFARPPGILAPQRRSPP